MKTFKLTSVFVLLIVAVIGLSSATASTPEKKKDLRQIISESVTYPESALLAGEQGNVDVAFKIGDDGNLQVKKIKSSDKEMSADVKSQLEKINVNDTKVDKFKTYQVRISFELK